MQVVSEMECLGGTEHAGKNAHGRKGIIYF